MKRNLLPLGDSRALVAIVAICAFFKTGTAPAWSLFSSEESREFKSAVTATREAAEAQRDGRVMDEIELLSEAGRTLAALAGKFPDYKADEVLEMRRANADRMRTLMTAVRSGEIAVPEPDAAWRGEDAASVVQPAAQSAAPVDGAAFRMGIPDLVRIEKNGEEAGEASSGPDPDELDPELASRLSSSIANPFFNDSGRSAVPSASVSVSEYRPSAESGNSRTGLLEPAAMTEEERLQLRAVAEMIQTARAPDAVILLEDIIDEKGENTPVAARILFARALLECRNYPRAREALDAIPPFADSDPSVRSLRAATYLAAGRIPEAQLEINQLLSEHPSWADAYIDWACVMYLADPKENRDEAIEYYRKGLERGARRDARLERQLGIKIGQ